jgi:hypothetical protein
MNTHDNLISLKGDATEIRRFVEFVYEDVPVKPGITYLRREAGFNRLNDFLKSGDIGVCCYEAVQWDEDLSRLCVDSKGVCIGRLLLAASKEFKLVFELETMDLDANPDEIDVNPASAAWKQYVIQGGTEQPVSLVRE